MTEDSFNERLAAIARALLHEPDVQATLKRTVADAAATLDGELYASVSLVLHRRQVETPVYTDDRALWTDQLQYELGQGPCLDAVWDQDTFYIDDLTTEPRYGDWGRRVVAETGIRSSLSLQLFTDPEAVVSLGSLNLYSPRPRSFDPDTRAEAVALAAHAAIALESAQTEANLRSGLVTRTVIGQAEGILMERLKITADQAFGVLSRLSQQSNVKLRDVARNLVETGEIPRI
ncbi:GAF and ANTAR domain-containing protein [Geodermatophilus poikilotrophus]|uniref:GAF domain-containing protein n=1 Tax=Geodermatophilus poikilotrophus TaxID=1333667 RepID=A0A1I0DXA9_9ACTN|nr:GAF and ANTAR domain-containing protein [Geodermatophilus poikilotrophus]SET37035.1 GAF domain-containing protein [Geodermatophilus poikilotrophus]